MKQINHIYKNIQMRICVVLVSCGFHSAKVGTLHEKCQHSFHQRTDMSTGKASEHIL